MNALILTLLALLTGADTPCDPAESPDSAHCPAERAAAPAPDEPDRDADRKAREGTRAGISNGF